MSKLQAVPLPAMFVNDWLHPANMSLLQKAVLAKKDRVTLANGKEFTIEYDRGYRSNFDGYHDGILLRPMEGFVPMGFVRMKRILDFEFEGGEHESE